MNRYLLAGLLCVGLAGCGSDDESSNGATNGSANATPNANTNNATNAASNGSTNAATNNSTNAATNNSTNNAPGADFISADVDGSTVLADSEEGGVEPMGDTVQLRKTTADTAGGGMVFIYRISLPNTNAASYTCADDDVSVTYSQLDGQLINNWVADTCTVEVTQGGDAAGDVIVGTFTASASDGATTIELANGAFSLTR